MSDVPMNNPEVPEEDLLAGLTALIVQDNATDTNETSLILRDSWTDSNVRDTSTAVTVYNEEVQNLLREVENVKKIALLNQHVINMLLQTLPS